MSLQYNLKKIIIFLLLVVLAGLFVTYLKRGGNVQPRLSKVQTQPFRLIALSYKGIIAKREQEIVFRKKIKQTHDHINSGKLKGILALIYEGNPDQTKDSIQAYVGVMTNDTLQTLPEGYKVYTFPTYRVVRAELKAHVSVAPNPEKINLMLKDFARKSGLQLNNTYIEKYISEEHIISEIVVRL